MPTKAQQKVFEEIRDRGLLSWMRWVVYQTVYAKGPLTAREIEDQCTSSSAGARLSELTALDVIQRGPKRPCTLTGRRAHTYEVTGRLPSGKIETKRPKNYAQMLRVFTKVRGAYKATALEETQLADIHDMLTAWARRGK